MLEDWDKQNRLEKIRTLKQKWSGKNENNDTETKRTENKNKSNTEYNEWRKQKTEDF